MSFVERLDVEDHRVLVTLARRLDREFGVTLGTNLSDQSVALVTDKAPGKAESLDAGVVLLQPQARDISLPFLTLDRDGRRNQACPPTQYLFVPRPPLGDALIACAILTVGIEEPA